MRGRDEKIFQICPIFFLTIGLTYEIIQTTKEDGSMMNILEMRWDYREICERVSALRDLDTRETRRAEAKAIIRDFNIKYERYALIDMIGREFL